ncbi:O-antigen ligase family protein [Thermosediminibacter oceani]|uniref:O-antigen polymerase n=1 Tax=Thermosediminibacter oceani (strain ATCC BAA-1034 / DSM 16646 / JW/IW-1228P) TaxID=555079 RepID=D9S1I6_THEOJ|nr:O-antigen ligase family protein [Thermosediminibacter oceani]ADL07263.1 O-antigen polymerase [Thermosediminibacter oceani DSM 16646]
MGRKKSGISATKHDISREKLTNERNTLYYLIFAGLLILLFYPPYFRGLFFDREILPTHIYSGIVFLAWVIYRSTNLKETRFFRSSIDYAALAVVGAYFLSIFAAVNLRYAVGELLKYINYFIVYYLVSDIARSEGDKKIILWTMVISAAGVALAGIGAAAGTINYPGAFVGGRINSTLQYPNTLAAYLTAALILGLGLQVTSERRWEMTILAAVNYTLFLAFIFALSRAAWLMFPVFYLILIISIPGLYKMKVIGYSLQTFAAGIFASPGFDSSISGGETSKVWFWYLVGLIFAIAVFYIFEKLSERFTVRIKPVTLLSVFVILTIITGVGVYIAFTTEKPLTLAHGPKEPESWKTSLHTVSNVKPDTEYVLKVIVTARPGQEQDKWGGAVLIKSVDKNNKETDIKSEFFNKALDHQLVEIPFKTRTDTTKLRIGFANNFPGTSVTFSNAEIFEANDRAAGQRIILAYKYIPEAVAQRLSSISFGEFSFQGRLSFYRDALKIIKEHPVLGIGGGGWKSAYFAYQSYRYFTTEVHSFFLQLMVETGIIGLLTFLAVLVLIIRNMIISNINKVDDQKHSALNTAALSSAVAILGHSAVDFNMSLPAVAIYLWALLGIAATIDGGATIPVAKRGQPASKFYATWVVCGITLLFILGSWTLYTGYSYGQKAVRAIQSGDIAGAKEAFEKASKYDPFAASFKADLSQIYDIIGEQGKNKEFKDKALKLREEAAAMEPYNAKLKSLLAATYLREGRLEEGLSLLEEAAKLNPYNISVWEALAEGYEKAAEVYIVKNEVDRAKELLGKCLDIPSKIIELNRKSPQSDPGVVKLVATKDLMLYLKKAAMLFEIPNSDTVKKLKDLVFAADFSIDLNEDGQPDLWTIWGEGEIKINPGENARVIPAGESAVTLYLSEGINLEPNQPYIVELKADVLEGGYKIDIVADNKEVFSLTADKGEFVAPDDIEGKDTRIRIFVNPKSDIYLGEFLLYKK